MFDSDAPPAPIRVMVRTPKGVHWHTGDAGTSVREALQGYDASSSKIVLTRNGDTSQASLDTALADGDQVNVKFVGHTNF